MTHRFPLSDIGQTQIQPEENLGQSVHPCDIQKIFILLQKRLFDMFKFYVIIFFAASLMAIVQMSFKRDVSLNDVTHILYTRRHL
jgi:hypothetical protein